MKARTGKNRSKPAARKRPAAAAMAAGPQTPALCGMPPGLVAQDLEQQYLAVLNLAGVGFARLSVDGELLYLNQALCDILGYRPDEVIGRPCDDLVAAAERESRRRERKQLLEGRIHTVSAEIHLVRKDGFSVPASFMLTAQRDGSGAAVCLVLIVEDISGRRRIEDTIRLLQTTVESIPLGITITDLDGRILYINHTEADMHGYTVGELLGREARSLAPGAHSAAVSVRELIEQNRIGPQPYIRETQNVRMDGTAFPVTITSALVRDLRGRPLGLVSVSEDISEQKRVMEALRESEFRHRTLFERANDAIFISDHATGQLTDCNAKACDLMRMTRGELIGMDLTLLHPPDDADEYRRLFGSMTEDRPVAMFYDCKVERRDGSRVWVDISSNLFTSGGRKLIMGIYRDISNRKQAEEQFVMWIGQLKESEARFRDMADMLPQPIFEADLDGRVAFTNRAAYEFFGYTEDELGGGLNVFDMIVPGDRARARDNVEGMLQGGDAPGNEYTALRKDGSTFPVIVYASPLLRQGRVAGIRGIVIDITERKRTEDILFQSKRDWEDTFDTITDMITIHDKDFNIIRSNKAAARILKLPWLRMGRAKCYEFYHGTAGPPEHCPSCECLRTGTPVVHEMFEPHLQRHLEIRAIPRLGADGALAGLIHVVRDISDRRKAEDERQALEARLRDAEKMETIGALAGGVAHEVRNPLNAIMALTDALDQEIGSDREYRTFMQHMRTQVERLSTLMTDLLDLGKPVEQAQLHSEPLEGICKLSFDAWRQSKWGRGRAVRLVAPQDGVGLRVRADVKKLQQVIINLLDNAAQHSPEHVELRIEVLPGNGRTAQVRVIDGGTGIPEDALPRVFDTFYTTRRGGTGLGLSIVKHIVEMHGGAITLANNVPPPGCTATVILPQEENATS